ncbi:MULTISPECIES: DUF423 domain-containing protein [Flavobacteriaceae]|jgi:uncharacterized membrane protein YgdD (TMEM256/DUF423 family)|uniref:DUF423 domain-containing protein n=2 Tax=Flavobacteriaceae TaxID=49546 RepID=A0ABN1JFG8_9FLAO|nr:MULTISPECIES: DUF423 domain-containing protein [Flavobacteriaceae]TDY13838.1 uncharacterized membrane protein YgdD (TMEM256/DUF423 family) [Meridianimaribacter flavus]
MNKSILITASILGILSIVLGAFAAHGLKSLISAEMIDTFETGVKYQMYHAILLLFVGSTTLVTQKAKKTIFYLVLVGVLFFSGSIYGLATNVLSSFDFKSIGFITPIGGLLLILSWVVLLINFLKLKKD